MGMPELDSSDISDLPLGIIDNHLAALIADAQLLATTNFLYPSDIENCLRLSAIFASDDEAVEVKVDLPNSIYLNIRKFKRALQGKKFYEQPKPSTNSLELTLYCVYKTTHNKYQKMTTKILKSDNLKWKYRTKQQDIQYSLWRMEVALKLLRF
ncbi:hypothetical protein RMCBS344292_12886 [Rhizopus microsporus]|nr:hypothetical protein RMCBS344292_12886 [Rhizopus microsporus]